MTTQCSAPQEVQDFSFMNVAYNSISYTWSPPAVTNGNIDRYDVSYVYML